MSAVTAVPEDTASAEEQEQQEQEAALAQLPLFEGHRVVETRMNFGGNVLITDQELIDALKLGQEIEFAVTARVVSRGHKSKDDRQTVSSANIVVDSIRPF